MAPSGKVTRELVDFSHADKDPRVVRDPADLSVAARDALNEILSRERFQGAKLWVEGRGFLPEEAKLCRNWYPNYLGILRDALEEREADPREDEETLRRQGEEPAPSNGQIHTFPQRQLNITPPPHPKKSRRR